MPLYLIRSGSNGEFEQRFLNEGRIHFTWSELATAKNLLQALVAELTNHPF